MTRAKKKVPSRMQPTLKASKKSLQMTKQTRAAATTTKRRRAKNPKKPKLLPMTDQKDMQPAIKKRMQYQPGAVRSRLRPKTVMSEPYISKKKEAVIRGSEGQAGVNPKANRQGRVARYGAQTGLQGPKADHLRAAVRAQPRAVMELDQLLYPTKNNLIPDEYGVTRHSVLPMQEIIPTQGGKWSGRTGPM
jgi:hypothetical protein